MEKKRFEGLLVDAARGDAWSMVEVGVCYHNGSGVGKNLTKAVSWWEKAAMTDDERWAKDACNCLINYYDKNELDKTVLWAERLYELGDSKALRKVAGTLCVREEHDALKGFSIYMHLYEREKEKFGSEDEKVKSLSNELYEHYCLRKNIGDYLTDEIDAFVKDNCEVFDEDGEKIDGVMKPRSKLSVHKKKFVGCFQFLLYFAMAVFFIVMKIRQCEAEKKLLDMPPRVVFFTYDGFRHIEQHRANSIMNVDEPIENWDTLENACFYYYNMWEKPIKVYMLGVGADSEPFIDSMNLIPYRYVRVKGVPSEYLNLNKTIDSLERVRRKVKRGASIDFIDGKVIVKDDYEKNLKKRKALDNAIDSLRRSVFVKPSLHDEDSYFAVLYEMVEENR